MEATQSRVIVVGSGLAAGRAAARRLSRSGAEVMLLSPEQLAPDCAHIRCRVDEPAEVMAALAEIGLMWDAIIYAPGRADYVGLTRLPAATLVMRDFLEQGLRVLRPGGAAVVVAPLKAPARKRARPESIASLLALGSQAEVPGWLRTVGADEDLITIARRAATEFLAGFAAWSWASRRVRVNTVTCTPHFSDDESADELADDGQYVVGPDDAASVALFLIAPESGLVNGQHIATDDRLARMASQPR